MKFSFLLLPLLFCFSAHAEFKTSAEALTKLKIYTPTYFADASESLVSKKENKKNSKKVEPKKPAVKDDDEDDASDGSDIDKLDAAFTDIQSAVTLLQQEKSWDAEVLQETLRVAALTLDNDPSWFAGEILLPLYHKDKKALMDAVKKLPAADAKNLEESITNNDRSQKKGNG